jgi:hypothetical protein
MVLEEAVGHPPWSALADTVSSKPEGVSYRECAAAAAAAAASSRRDIDISTVPRAEARLFTRRLLIAATAQIQNRVGPKAGGLQNSTSAPR